ncbi:hypothetical protein JWZ98_22950 (plasmid) [Methylomonas sp. EFPC1]|uniref:hypothetical protein n=1 Tax=Methylomonas sp. EFPC1 TaxID=2812647 RepID=UPI001968A07B|nr:hypothetical protein [Methylomonas sp. EFPC1]QSB03772.1 hypothetical protein JWZ98_22950 [Methylomonas sp. EFPC1]
MKISNLVITHAIRALTCVFIVLTGFIAYMYEVTPETFMQYHAVLFFAFCVIVAAFIGLICMAFVRCHTLTDDASQQLVALKKLFY